MGSGDTNESPSERIRSKYNPCKDARTPTISINISSSDESVQS